MHVIEEAKFSTGVSVKIYPDPEPWSPAEWDNLGEILYMKHSRYVLGTKGVTAEEAREIEQDPENVWMPVYAYVHSGSTISTKPFSCPWDSGQSGIVYTTKEKIREAYGDDSEASIAKARECLAAEVETFDRYLRGDVYGWEAFDAKGNVIDSCWGCYDDPAELLKEIAQQYGHEEVRN